ncbi:hypothetical protein [Halorussus lipolyticus]|uniref:hypothetical protein n=1 Tax=Halorussus lipolyticus TaxID=3034024 RepID=UPI0023E8BC22|nr:hypothetical protein [Halorussus sp. DT80]
MYQNSSYQQVVISQEESKDSYEYNIKLLRDDNELEGPSNASGGERAIVNLALRAGIYRLVAEKHGGDRGSLPPLILDEPTTPSSVIQPDLLVSSCIEKANRLIVVG